MPKNFRITPYRPSGRRVYCATFADATGRRITRSLGTEDESAAVLACAGLARLVAIRPPDPSRAPAEVPDRLVALYFGQPRPTTVVLHEPRPIDLALLEGSPHRRELYRALVEREQMEGQLERATADLAGMRAELDSLKTSMLAHAALAAQSCPPLADALDQFERHMKATTIDRHARVVVSIARRFAKTLPSTTRSPAAITAEQIAGWLDVAGTTIGRRAKLRNRIGRFMRWSSTTWGFPSPMSAIRAPSASQLRRERGEIHWHELPEVEKALEALPSDYWRALVATLAFAGLRLAELAWLRRSDVQELADGRRQLWITTVDDGHGGRHALKTGHSERAVEIHPKRLWPQLEKHLREGAGEVFLFPATTRRRARGSDGHGERWIEHTLGRVLSGDPGGASRKPRVGLLPNGMGPASLRRTFGSLMLRDGVSVAAVAAAMGNTPNVVQAHYARILGSEVRVGF